MDRVAGDVGSVGVAAASGVLSERRLVDLRAAVDDAVARDADRLPADRWDEEYGRVLFLPSHGSNFLSLLDEGPILDVCDRLLGSDCILYTMTTSCSRPGGSGRPLHLDLRHVIPGYLLALGVSILLDDFDETSGSTRFLPGVREHPPAREEFDSGSLRLNAPAGSVCWADGRLWHDATANMSSRWRRCVILAVVRGYVRQRFDVPRMTSHLNFSALTPRVRQKLGFDVLPPGSYEEYYMSPADRRDAILGLTDGHPTGVNSLG